MGLKSPKLAPTDQLTFGKFKGCRICDIVEDEYEYLIFMEKHKFVSYNKETIALIHKHGNFAAEKRYLQEEVIPYIDDYIYNELDELPF